MPNTSQTQEMRRSKRRRCARGTEPRVFSFKEVVGRAPRIPSETASQDLLGRTPVRVPIDTSGSSTVGRVAVTHHLLVADDDLNGFHALSMIDGRSTGTDRREAQRMQEDLRYWALREPGRTEYAALHAGHEEWLDRTSEELQDTHVATTGDAVSAANTHLKEEDGNDHDGIKREDQPAAATDLKREDQPAAATDLKREDNDDATDDVCIFRGMTDHIPQFFVDFAGCALLLAIHDPEAHVYAGFIYVPRFSPEELMIFGRALILENGCWGVGLLQPPATGRAYPLASLPAIRPWYRERLCEAHRRGDFWVSDLDRWGDHLTTEDKTGRAQG